MTQPTSPPTCNTPHPIYPILQYNFWPTAHPKAMSRYNFPLYRDTVLGSSPNQCCTFFFFSFFFHTFATGKYTHTHTHTHTDIYIYIYIYIIVFPSFASTPNKLIKIYFIHFPSVLLTVKPKISSSQFFFSLILDHFVQNSSKPYVLTLTLVFNLKTY